MPTDAPSADDAPPGSDGEPGRRRAVLEAALELLAEHGYAGASLRKLAARVGISQPSLYHYFRTKEVLVETVLATYAGDMFGALDPAALPRRLEDVPRWVVDSVYTIYGRPSHAKFVRVAFSVSRSNPRFGSLLRTIFVDQADAGMRLAMQRFVDAGEVAAEEAAMFVRVLVNAIGLRFMEEKVLFQERELGDSFHRFAEMVVQVGETWVRAQRRRKR